MAYPSPDDDFDQCGFVDAETAARRAGRAFRSGIWAGAFAALMVWYVAGLFFGVGP